LDFGRIAVSGFSVSFRRRLRVKENVPLMNRLNQTVLLFCSLGLLAFVLSCGQHPSTLQSIAINPTGSSTNITGASAQVLAAFPTKYTAYGTFIHPPETRDISSQVTWTSNAPLATVDSMGNVRATNFGCGTAVITATANASLPGGNLSSDMVVSGSATYNATEDSVADCGGPSAPTLVINEAGTGSGTVTSLPSGIDCISNAGACGATFASGNQVILTASPAAGSTFNGWSSNCVSTSPTSCQADLTFNLNVVATFNK
jgi:hypothetical protein